LSRRIYEKLLDDADAQPLRLETDDEEEIIAGDEKDENTVI